MKLQQHTGIWAGVFIFLFPFATCVWHFLKLTPPNALRQLFFILPNACIHPSADRQLFLSHSLLFLINQALYAIPRNTLPSCPALTTTNYLILFYRPCSKTLALLLFLSLSFWCRAGWLLRCSEDQRSPRRILLIKDRCWLYGRMAPYPKALLLALISSL